jgi:hypothetical protein
MDAAATIRAYYDALRAGEPLAPFFARDEDLVKFGIGERLEGFSAVEAGLSEQTETTEEWTVESDRLRVTEREAHAWFSDSVYMAWTDRERAVRFEFDSRWSGTLERRPEAPAADLPGTPWRFVGMHVSAPGGTR